MDGLAELLIHYGYWGMLLAAFLAGTVLPFSSEVVMVGLAAAGLDVWALLVYGTLGNVAGSMLNYYIGTLGRLDWIERYLRVGQDKMDRARRLMARYGVWVGFFAFLPVIGSAIAIVLGLVRSNVWLTLLTFTAGKVFRYVVIICSLLSLTGCIGGPPQDRRQITVTIEPLRYFTEQIAGNRFEVKTMVPRGGNPETYEPAPQQMVRLSAADLYIKVGSIGFERTWMKRLVQNAPHTVIVDASAGIAPACSAHGATDPHTWMSTANAAQMARNIYRALVQVDRKDSAYFRQNLDRLLAAIEATDKQVRQQIKECPSAAFLIYHPALTYFARDYGLKQMAVEEEGREPSAAQLKQTINAARKQNVKVMFVQKEFVNRNTQIVARAVGAETVDIDPLNYDWHKEMIGIARKLK